MPFDPPFSGYIQPPTVPPDPTGDEWRGEPGAAGPAGAAGPQGPPGATVGVLPVGTTAGRPNSGDQGFVRFNTDTGRYEFGIGGSWINHVRLSGDTMGGPLTLSGTNALTVGGVINFGLGVGAGASDIVAQNTGNVRFTIPTAGILNFKTASTNLFQVNTGGTNASFLPLQSTLPSLNIAGNGAAAPAKSVGYFSTGPVSGTMSGGGTAPLWYLSNGADTVACTLNGASVGLMLLQQTVGGASATGSRVANQNILTFSAASGSKAAGLTGAFYGAMYPVVQVQAGDGGVDFTATGSFGDFYAINPVAHALNGATFLHGLNGMEIDIAADAGSSVRQKTAMLIVALPTDAVNASAQRGDGAIMLSNTVGASAPWRDFGINFGSAYASWPMGANSALFLATPDVSGNIGTAKWGTDFQMATFPATGNPYDGGLLRGNGVAIDGGSAAGYATMQLGSAYLTSSATGLAIDCKGSVGASAAVVAGGTNWVSGYLATDPYGGLWQVTAAAGVATAWTLRRAPYYPSTTPPANPIALTAFGSAGIDHSAAGATVNITWTSNATTLAFQAGGGAVQAGSGAWSANGSVATALSSIGPVGSHTTVQEWFTVRNAAGTVRYIPAF